MFRFIIPLFLLFSYFVLISQAITIPNPLDPPICSRNDLYISTVSNDSLALSWRNPADWGLDSCHFVGRVFLCDQHIDSLKFTYTLLDTAVKYMLSSIYDTNITSVIIPRLEYGYFYGTAYASHSGCPVSDGYIPAGSGSWGSWPLKVYDYSNIGIMKSKTYENRFVFSVQGNRIDLVNIAKSKSLFYTLYNSIGQTVLTNSVSAKVIDVSSLKNGLYILKLNGSDYSSINKIILAR